MSLVNASGAQAPGAKITLTMNGVRNVRLDADAQMVRYEYTDAVGNTNSIWVSSAASLASRLSRLSSFNIRGITLRGLLDSSNSADLLASVSDIARGNTNAGAGKRAALQVRIADANGTGGSTVDVPIDAGHAACHAADRARASI